MALAGRSAFFEKGLHDMPGLWGGPILFKVIASSCEVFDPFRRPVVLDTLFSSASQSEYAFNQFTIPLQTFLNSDSKPRTSKHEIISTTSGFWLFFSRMFVAEAFVFLLRLFRKGGKGRAHFQPA